MRSVSTTGVGSASLIVGAMAGTILLTGAGCGALMNSRSGTVHSAESDCAGIATKERELGLLAYPEAIAGARPLHEQTNVGRMMVLRERGTVVMFRAEPNLSAPWLRRVNACHADLVAAGQASGAGAADPFVVSGTTVSVDETQTGYAVGVRASSPEGAAEVARRVAGLSTGHQEAMVLNAL